jgi:hypothetical protein
VPIDFISKVKLQSIERMGDKLLFGLSFDLVLVVFLGVFEIGN